MLYSGKRPDVAILGALSIMPIAAVRQPRFTPPGHKEQRAAVYGASVILKPTGWTIPICTIDKQGLAVFLTRFFFSPVGAI